jgi:arabinan endo-1,5-alpha-L-arabinosidase
MRTEKALRLLLCAALCLHAADMPAQTEAPKPRAYKLEGDVEGVHDPSIIKQGSTWYLFSTTTEKGPEGQLPIRCSQDLHHWKLCGYVL